MIFEEIAPYLNKIVHMKLKNKKRKVGWLVCDHYHEISEVPLREVHCVKVRFGEKNIYSAKRTDIKILKQNAETYQIEDILKIRSCI